MYLNNKILKEDDKSVPNKNESEVIYHVFQRSFYDSNGDGHGDLKGLELKLDYLNELGVSSILILPLYDSPFYHNYFANNFRKIDPTYGGLEDFKSLVNAIHEREMKIYLDMEIHYVAEDNHWFKDSFQNPNSIYSNHILYNGPNNCDPESIIFDLTSLKSYNGIEKKVASLNLKNPVIRDFIFEEFKFWIDPFNDGSLRSGVDGFRIDHMMDDLDWKGTTKGLLANFWKPLFSKLKTINPNVKFMGEQADWESFGVEYFVESDVDFMFAFPLKFAIESWNKDKIVQVIESMERMTPEQKFQIIFIENHDTNRFATDVNNNEHKLRIGAVLNLLLKGIPAIYYGQELGMEGAGGFSAFGLTDGNDIPRREAFPWQSVVDSRGTALWYKDTGPWWDQTILADHNGISVEEQKHDPKSLYHFYKNIIGIRNKYESFYKGGISIFENNNDQILSFLRFWKEQTFIIHLNLSSETNEISNLTESQKIKNGQIIFSYPTAVLNSNNILLLEPFGIQIIQLS